MDLAPDLDLIGGLMGTDKSSAHNNYLIHYDRLFQDIRTEAFNFIEIGIFQGASLATWRQYFTKATVIGVDIQESCRQYARPNVMVEIGSQDDPAFLLDLARRYPPRVVIDDGSHMAHHILFSFETLFPAIEPGGIYVVEDLYFHAQHGKEHFRGPAKANPIDYFADLARIVAGNWLEQERKWGLEGYLFQSIDEIAFLGTAVAIRKRATKVWSADRGEAVIRMAEEASTVDAWERASKYLAGNGARTAAIDALRRAIEIEPLGRLYYQVSLLQDYMGDRKEAIESVQRAIDKTTLRGERAACLEHLGSMLIHTGQVPEGISLYQDALALAEHPMIKARLKQKLQRHGVGASG